MSISIGELRGMLLEAPSKALWVELWKGLEKLKPQELEQVYFPYLEAHLAGWPPGLRVAPKAVMPQFLRAKGKGKGVSKSRTVLLPLIDALCFSSQQSLSEQQAINLANNPLAAALRVIHLPLSDLSTRAFRALAASPHLQDIHEFGITSARLTPSIMNHLAQSAWLPEIESLRGCIGGFTKRSPPTWNLPRLKTLHFDHSDSDSFLSTLFDTESPPALEEISCNSTRPKQDTFALLLRETGGTSLRTLSFQGYSFQEYDWAAVFDACTTTPRLESISLRHEYGNAIRFCLDLPALHLPHLKHLTLQRCELTPVHLKSIKDAKYLEHIETLDLSFNELGDEGIEHLSESPHLASLRHLNLRATVPKAHGIELLVTSPVFAQLQSLNLANNRLGVKATQPLREAHNLQHLTSLDLSTNNLTDDAIEGLIQNPANASLKDFSFLPNHLSIPMLFLTLTTPEQPRTWRTQAMQNMLEVFTRDELFEFNQRLGLTGKKSHKKDALLETLIAGLHDPPSLLDLLCSASYLQTLTARACKATLRYCGAKQYSKLKGRALLALTQTTILAHQDELLALRQP